MMATFKQTQSGQNARLTTRIACVTAALLLGIFSTSAQAQEEVRYSWFEISYVAQDVGRSGTQISLADPLEPQLVEINGTDGSGNST
jgi:hypothetical protein